MKPLFVDLDGTLLFNDSVQEVFFRLLLKSPWLAFISVITLITQGRAPFKTYLAEHVPLKNIQWPINPIVLDLIQKEKIRGRKVILLTATHEKIARSIVEPLQLFDQIEGSTATRDFKGHKKLAWIQHKYFSRFEIRRNTDTPQQSEELPHQNIGFLYAGNSSDDLVLWKRADEAIIVNPSQHVLKTAQKINKDIRLIQNKPNRFYLLQKMLRFHQYSKNLLIFIPLLVSGKMFQGDLIWSTFLAWMSFSATASIGYIINDFVDVDHDRAHESKKYRPFASGQINFGIGVAWIMGLMLITMITAFLLPGLFSWVLIGYFVLTIGYSFFLKQLAIIDVFVLSILYLIRIMAGSTATSISISYWLFVFALFFFLSLAYLKRFIEIKSMRADQVKGRNYKKQDLLLVKISGLTLGFLSVLIFTLYINTNASTMIYKYPNGLWIITLLLLYWINYIWHAAIHQKVHDDPIKFALTDKISLIVGMLIIAVIIICQGWIL